MLSPLQLAYIGDSVYEVLIRNYLLENNNCNVNELHKKAIRYVKANSQKEIILMIKEKLSEKEWTIVKRGRNSKSNSVPKNADITDYRYATGFEALIGYLFITGNYDRIREIFSLIIRNFNS